MRGLLVAGALACSLTPCLAQTQGLPPISQLLPQVIVEPPSILEAIDPTSRETSRRVAGPFAIRNGSRYDLKDIEINCSYMAPSGTVIGSHTLTVYDIFRAGARQTSVALMLPSAPEQVQKVNCKPSGGVVLAVGTPTVDPCPDCTDAAERFRTCDCDMAEVLQASRRNPRYLIPLRHGRRGARLD